MILILTNATDVTADFVCNRLRSEGRSFTRFNSDYDLGGVRVRFHSRGEAYLCLGDLEIRPSDISGIWYRRPSPLRLPFPARDAAESKHILNEWTEALEGILAHVPLRRWLNHPSRNSLASRKLEQLSRARSAGLRVPDTLVTQDAIEARKFCVGSPDGVVVKPLGSGYLERQDQTLDTQIFTSIVETPDLSHLELVTSCPTLFQRRIVKDADVRICVVDGTLECVAMRATDASGEQRLDIRRNNMRDVKYEIVSAPHPIKAELLELVRSYELRFAAIDMAIDREGNWFFFEVNPNGQWAWLDMEAGTNITTMLIDALSEGHGR